MERNEITKLQELRKNIERDNIELNKLKNKKLLNYQMTQPGSPNLKELFVSGTPIFTDTFLQFVIRDEDIDADLEILSQKLKNEIEEYNDIIKYLARYDNLVLIEYLHYYEGWKWEKIDNYLHYGTDSSRTKYKRSLSALKKD